MANRAPRTLHDLYVLGETVLIPVPDFQREDPDVPENIVVWVQKLDPLDQDVAVRKAKAARARRRAVMSDRDGDDFMAIVDYYDRLTPEQRIDVVVTEEDTNLQNSARAELQLGEDSEWAKDGYLQGLIDSWTDGLEARFVEDPDDPDAKHVLDELNRFEQELAADLVPQRNDLRDMNRQLAPEELREKVIDQLVDQECQAAFISEYVSCQTWLSTRQPCKLCAELKDGQPVSHQARHAARLFADREDVDRLEPAISGQLQTAYLRVSVDPTEGKGLRAIRDSSESSEPSDLPETAPSSGQLAAVG